MTAYSIPSEFLNQNPNSKATFRPGGDAQYVSYLLGGMINWIADYDHNSEEAASKDFQTEYVRVLRAEMGNLGFSDSLALKFQAAGHRILDREIARQEKALDKAAKKAAKAQKAEAVITYKDLGGIKIGRWTYPTRQVSISDSDETYTERNTKTNGTGEWVALEA